MRYVLILLLCLISPAIAGAQSPFVEDDTSVLVSGVAPSIAALWGDFDDDGDLDLLVTDNEGGDFDTLYRNEGGGDFTALSFVSNGGSFVATNSATWADVNNDGQLDLVSASLNGGSVLVNLGSTGGTPAFAQHPSPLDFYNNQREVPVADYDGDGWLDIAVVRRFNSSDLLLRNEWPGFSLIFASDRKDGASGCWGDADNDGLPAFYVANSSADPNIYYANRNGHLQPRSTQAALNDTGRSQSCSWGDYDNDGDLDLAFTNYDGTDRIIRNDDLMAHVLDLGGSNLTRTFGSSWGDVDNDGDLDLVLARVDDEDTLYLNDGAGAFTPIAVGSASDGHGVAATLVDDDEDGDLDLFISYGGYNLFQRDRLYRNMTDGAGSWLEVDLRRPSGVNRFGVGAHVYAYATVGGEPRTLLRPVVSRPGRQAQEGYRVHFGLGDATVIDSLVVDWPQGVEEERTVLYDVSVNQIITVAGTVGEGDVVAMASSEAVTAMSEYPASFAVEGVHPNPSRGDFTLVVRSGGDAPVRTEVLDMLGRRVRVLEGKGEAGDSVRLYWDGADAQGQPAAEGFYLLRVRQGGDEDVMKVTLLR